MNLHHSEVTSISDTLEQRAPAGPLFRQVLDSRLRRLLRSTGTKKNRQRRGSLRFESLEGRHMLSASGGNPVIVLNTTVGSVPIELLRDQVPVTVDNFLKYVRDGDYNRTIFHRYIPGFVIQGGSYLTDSNTYTNVTQFTSISTDPPIPNEFDNWAKLTGTGATLTNSSVVISLGSNVDLSHVGAGDRVRLDGRTDGLGNSNMFDIIAVSDANDTVTLATSPTGPSANNLNWTIFPKVNVAGTLSMAKLGNDPNGATSEFFLNLGDNSAFLDVQAGGYTVFARVLDVSSIHFLSSFTTSNQGGPFSSLPIADNNQLAVLNSVTALDTLFARNDIFNVDEDSPNVTLPVLDNDTRPPDSSITSISTPSKGGTVTIAADKQYLIYTPAANFNGEETFQYNIGTVDGQSSSATVTVQVAPINGPTAVDDLFTVDSNSSANVLKVLDNDTPDATGDVLRVVSVPSQPNRGGSVVISPDARSLLYTPAAWFEGVETFSYLTCDSSGACNDAGVVVNVRIPFSYVDSNNNRTFDPTLDVPLTRGELEDGTFSTTTREGGYTKIIAGAGLVINNPIKVKKDLNFRAAGILDARAKLEAGRDVSLRGGSIDIQVGASSGRDLLIRADAGLDVSEASLKSVRDIRLTAGDRIDASHSTVVSQKGDITVQAAKGVDAAGVSIVAGRDLKLLAGGDLGVPSAELKSVREIRLTAGGRIDASSSTIVSQKGDIIVHATRSVWMDTASVSAHRDISVRADTFLFAPSATFQGGRDVTLRAKGSDFDPILDDFPLPVPVQVAMSLNASRITAARDVLLMADQASVELAGIIAKAGKTIQVRARETIFADLANATAGKEIAFRAKSIVGTPVLHAPKVKLVQG